MEKIKKLKNLNIPIIMTITKYVFALILTFLAFSVTKDFRYLFINIFELFIIVLISNMLIRKKVLGRIVNTILMLMYNAQMIVMTFANSYVTMLMLTNVESIESLAGKAVLYITGAVLVLTFSLLPITKLNFGKIHEQSLLSSVLCLELIFTLVIGNVYSPIYGYFDLGIQQYHMIKLNMSIEDALKDAQNYAASNSGNTDGNLPTDMISYYSESIADHRKKDSNLPEQPNVILILTEGLSQGIVSDERGVMPNVSNYQKLGLSFSNYYNHTFATYRGLIGQLYSGYQLKNFDTNELISLQSILSDQGYYTAFINSEPHNPEFTEYLDSFDFDELINDTSLPCTGPSSTLSDKETYESLLTLAEEYDSADKPFFLATYTFGTHMSLDSPDEKFGNGVSPELNKFYNSDYQFNQFMNQFMESPVSDNTIIVFSTDHATFVDGTYDSTFPLEPRVASSLDTIPFFIYHKGITPEVIDVNGRNSLCLAPTILDYLDISAPNYFLGTSLFAESAGSILETRYSDSYTYYSTTGGSISDMSETEQEKFRTMQQDYFITKEVIAMQNK